MKVAIEHCVAAIAKCLSGGPRLSKQSVALRVSCIWHHGPALRDNNLAKFGNRILCALGAYAVNSLPGRSMYWEQWPPEEKVQHLLAR